MFHGSAPVLFVKDLTTSLDYYCDVLGFDRPALWGDPPDFAMPKRERMILMLSQAKDADLVRPKAVIWDVYFWVSDAQKLFAEYSEKGAIILREPVYQTGYGNLEFIIEDPDGYTLAFGQELTEDAFFEVEPDGAQGDTKFLFMCPVLASSDVPRDIRWYEEKLGFKNVFDSTHYSDGPADYAVLRRQKLILHLQYQFPKDMTSTDVRIEVRNIQPLFEEYVAKDVVNREAMRLQTAWGTNEFGLFDPSGNRITFLEDI